MFPFGRAIEFTKPDPSKSSASARAILDGKTGLMSAMVNGCYDLVPFPDPRLGPRKADVATMYNTERYRPIYVNKRGLPIFLNRA